MFNRLIFPASQNSPVYERSRTLTLVRSLLPGEWQLTARTVLLEMLPLTNSGTRFSDFEGRFLVKKLALYFVMTVFVCT